MRRLDDESKRLIEAGLRRVRRDIAIPKTAEEIQQDQHDFERQIADLFALINSFQADEIYDYLYSLYNGGIHEDMDDATLRGRAFQALSQLPGRDPSVFLSEVIRHEDFGWRAAACDRIGELGKRVNGSCINLLCNALLKDEDPDVRFSAVKALAEVGDASALSALRHAEANDEGEDYEGWPISGAAKKAIEAILART